MARRVLLGLLWAAGPLALLASTYAAWNPGDLRYAGPLAARYPLPAITFAAFAAAAYHALRTARPGVLIPWLPIVLTLAALTGCAFAFGGYRVERTGPVVVSPDGRHELVEVHRKRRLPAAEVCHHGTECHRPTPEYTTLQLRSREGVLSRDIEVYRDGPVSDEPDILDYGFDGPETITLLVRAEATSNPIRYLARVHHGARSVRWRSDMPER